ncbi:MAG TPA: hypothetical protein PK156_36660 [Polyangium sp.]|nr:hypothetical protein [Polyangium sp.]
MHTLTFVFIPDSASNARDEVELVMAGSNFEPEREYPTYEERCFCVGTKARNESRRDFDEVPRGIALKNQWSAARVAHDDALEKSIIRERYLAVQELQIQHPAHEQPDPRCSVCRGAGFCVRSRDPARHYDWWVIGGRWKGYFSTMEDLVDEDGHSYQGNVARVRDISPNTLPGAIVTADGLWYEQPVDISGIVDIEEELPYEKQAHQRWCQQVTDIYAQHSGHFVVVVDVHL